MNKRILKAVTILLAALMLMVTVPAFAAGDVRVVVVSPKKLTLGEGEQYRLTVAANDGGSLPAMVWESSDPQVASVDSSGNLTALKAGSAKIKVYSADGSTDSSTCRVKVQRIKKTPIDAELEGNAPAAIPIPQVLVGRFQILFDGLGLDCSSRIWLWVSVMMSARSTSCSSRYTAPVTAPWRLMGMAQLLRKASPL